MPFQSENAVYNFLRRSVGEVLKEQCHEDFAVLGQFCAKIITLRLNHKQNASVKLRRRYQTNFIREG